MKVVSPRRSPVLLYDRNTIPSDNPVRSPRTHCPPSLPEIPTILLLRPTFLPRVSRPLVRAHKDVARSFEYEHQSPSSKASPGTGNWPTERLHGPPISPDTTGWLWSSTGQPPGLNPDTPMPLISLACYLNFLSLKFTFIPASPFIPPLKRKIVFTKVSSEARKFHFSIR